MTEKKTNYWSLGIENFTRLRCNSVHSSENFIQASNHTIITAMLNAKIEL